MAAARCASALALAATQTAPRQQTDSRQTADRQQTDSRQTADRHRARSMCRSAWEWRGKGRVGACARVRERVRGGRAGWARRVDAVRRCHGASTGGRQTRPVEKQRRRAGYGASQTRPFPYHEAPPSSILDPHRHHHHHDCQQHDGRSACAAYSGGCQRESSCATAILVFLRTEALPSPAVPSSRRIHA
eukprot:493914-Rhodomonas_salina.6